MRAALQAHIPVIGEDMMDTDKNSVRQETVVSTGSDPIPCLNGPEISTSRSADSGRDHRTERLENIDK